MNTLNFNAYCGMSWKIEEGDLDKCRIAAAQILRKRKRTGHFIHKIKENVWECQEPENSFMVPDTAGTLVLSETPEEFDSEELSEEFNDEC